ncbi:exported hypothetical protein [Mesorhizobium sp. STM 4661]|nr:exported hypothetical protein [Mesorhizobium sp. STM 4661]
MRSCSCLALLSCRAGATVLLRTGSRSCGVQSASDRFGQGSELIPASEIAIRVPSRTHRLGPHCFWWKRRAARRAGHLPDRLPAAKDIECLRIGHAQQIRDHRETARFSHLQQLIGHGGNVLKVFDFGLAQRLIWHVAAPVHLVELGGHVPGN